MNKKQLAILERAWEADIAHALKESPFPLFQSKSKVVQQLANDGYLEYIEFKDRGITFKGYHITHLGILTYCASLPPEESKEAK
ncbi:hypothetical protein [Pseudescherichia sp.]|uniref:hypothetical protein n=1 Tax=Pseudescherichia sp. TaxID=2055881 RepID=UPI0028A1E27C|nr:hypothetical protein [Pseudescherichia sp.]